jgi:hypothetical protein
MKLNGSRRIIAVVVVVVVIVAAGAVWLIAGRKASTANHSSSTNGTIATPTPNAAPTLRPGSTETVIDIAANDPLLPYLSPGVHIDLLKLSGGQAQIIASDLVVLGVQATGVTGATPPPVQTAASSTTPGAGSTPAAVATAQAPSAGLIVDVPTAEEGSVLVAQTGTTGIAYAIVGTAAAAPPTPAPTQAPTPTPTPTPVASPSATPATSPSGSTPTN